MPRSTSDVTARLGYDRSTRTAAALVPAMAHALEGALRRVLTAGTVCALVDFPTQQNVGDSAIWLGERRVLRRLGIRVGYACHIDAYAPGDLAARVEDGPIIIHGGGNFGDVWTRNQAFRERLIADFPDRLIIQMPQWVYFQDPDTLRRARAVLNQHSRLIVFARDRPSLEILRSEFRAECHLMPDAAMALGPLRRRPPVEDVVWLARTDRESMWPEQGPVAGVSPTDWRCDQPSRRLAVVRRLAAVADQHLRPRSARMETRLWWYDALAVSRLHRGSELLSRGRVVVTDRIHGYLLCLLLGIPHVLLDTRFGKLRAFHDTWARDCELTTWGSSPEDALAQARTQASLLQR